MQSRCDFCRCLERGVWAALPRCASNSAIFCEARACNDSSAAYLPGNRNVAVDRFTLFCGCDDEAYLVVKLEDVAVGDDRVTFVYVRGERASVDHSFLVSHSATCVPTSLSFVAANGDGVATGTYFQRRYSTPVYEAECCGVGEFQVDLMVLCFVQDRLWQ